MRIDLVYASTSGNVEIVCETIARILGQNGFEIVLSRAEKTPIETIKKNKYFVFGTSTWEHGRLNPFFEKLFEEMKTLNFNSKQAAFVGLGDRRYESVKFCEGIKQVLRLWLINGGEKVGSPLLIQGEPYEQLDAVVKPWANSVASNWS